MLEILKFPDDRLKQVSVAVTEFNGALGKLLDEMVVAMYGANGIGLAAPQVGQAIRAFVIDLAGVEGYERKLYEFVNPKLMDGEGSISFEEGCLSVPGYVDDVTRKERIAVDYQDRFGKAHSMKAEGLLSVAIQHENDHLDGILFVDRLSPLKRRLVKRRLLKSVTL